MEEDKKKENSNEETPELVENAESPDEQFINGPNWAMNGNFEDTFRSFMDNMGPMIEKLSSSRPPNGDIDGKEIACEVIGAIVGEDAKASAQRLFEIQKFFEEKLKEGGLKFAIRESKEKFNLPDDYTLDIEMKIKFLSE